MMKILHFITLALLCYLCTSCVLPWWFLNFDTKEQPRLKDGEHNFVLNLCCRGTGIDMSKKATLTQLNCFSSKPLLDVRKIMITHEGNPVPFKVKTYNEHGKWRRVKSTIVLPEHHLLYLYLKTATQVKDSDEICITESVFPFQGDTLSFKTLYRTHSRAVYRRLHDPSIVTCFDDEGHPIADICLQFNYITNIYYLDFRGITKLNEYTGIPVKRAKSIEKAIKKRNKNVIYMIKDSLQYELSSSDLQLYDFEPFCKGMDVRQIRNAYDIFYGFYPANFVIVPDKNRELTEDDQLIILPGNLLIYHGKPLITEPIRLSLCPKHEGEK